MSEDNRMAILRISYQDFVIPGATPGELMALACRIIPVDNNDGVYGRVKSERKDDVAITFVSPDRVRLDGVESSAEEGEDE